MIKGGSIFPIENVERKFENYCKIGCHTRALYAQMFSKAWTVSLQFFKADEANKKILLASFPSSCVG